jgi:hypothetical protein
MKSFIENKNFIDFLNRSWSDEKGYLDQGQLISNNERLQLLIYHTYRCLAKGENTSLHLNRAEFLAGQISACITTSGLLSDEKGNETDHPAHGSSVADALGTFAFYGKKISAQSDKVRLATDALLRIADYHPRIRPPGGLVGRTQQLRFETRVFYWAWRITENEKYKNYFLELFENGMHAYTHPVAIEGGLVQPSLHPDYTWNYTCTSGTTTEYATNSHTPVYYATEPQGFAFVYLHGLKDGVLKRNVKWDDFCQKYFEGLLRNLSRAGHTSSDLDGYGIHRAWYSSCLVESIPLEASVGETIGLDEKTASQFRWYLDRYIDFVKRSSTFEKTGLPETIPYGQNLTIEKQFPALGGARFYAMIARALYEYEVEKKVSTPPPAFLSYAWWHHWVRVSTPIYETSFVGTTSLCRVPMVKHYGDPHLGCIHGGSPLSTLFCGDELMYATSNDPAGLWHVELQDTEGNLFRSIATSFEDETATTLLNSKGELKSFDSFENYQRPVNLEMNQNPSKVLWHKKLRSSSFRFFVANEYTDDSLSCDWGFHSPQGNVLKKASFCLAIPKHLNPEWKDVKGKWHPLVAAATMAEWPQAVRWTRGKKSVHVELKTAKADGTWICEEIPTELGRPGGENSFCPYQILQVRLAVLIEPNLERVNLNTHFTFSSV